ncbi:MAG: hypothetical protein P1U83_18620 [Roseovarius sp.]|nr:hypothetical protein [Roseovarius sp.]
MFKKFIRLAKSTFAFVDTQQQISMREELERLQSLPRFADPKSLVPHGYKVCSQADEDGMIAEIFNRIGTTNRFFVEFGIGNGLENNTLALLFQGWKGIWIEANDKACAAIRNGFKTAISTRTLRLEEAFINRDNIDGLIGRNIDEAEIDLLSVDIDGNDWHVYDGIKCINPRVIVFEYNAKFYPPISYCMAYDSDHIHQNDDCFGMSLQFLVDEMTPRGYALVGCNISGANAFFVREDLLADKFEKPNDVAHHFLPARYHLARLASGHPAAYHTLERALPPGQ